MRCMRVGHIDGLGKVYDAEGRPFIDSGERLVWQLTADNLDVSEGSGFWSMRTLFPYSAEKGDLHITTRRILFLRKPDPLLAAKYDAYPLGMADAVANAIRARDLKKMKALEFCEIDLSEVEGFWVRKRDYGVLFLRSDSTVTRKAIMHRRGPGDRKFEVLKDLLSDKLPVTEPEDRQGSFLIGKRYPFRGRRRK